MIPQALYFLTPIVMLGAFSTSPKITIKKKETPQSETNYESVATTSTTSSYKRGDFAQGGVIVWVTADGQHGLVAAIEDIVSEDGNSLFLWAPDGKYDNIKAAETNLDLPIKFQDVSSFPGKTNTQAITDFYGEDGIYAAKLAANYSKTINGITYSD